MAPGNVEPTGEVMATWTCMGDALAWAGFSDFSTLGSEGWNICDVLGITCDSDLGDIGVLYKDYLADWKMQDAMGNLTKAKPGSVGKATRFGHAVRLACSTDLAYAEQATAQQELLCDVAPSRVGIIATAQSLADTVSRSLPGHGARKSYCLLGADVR